MVTAVVGEIECVDYADDIEVSSVARGVRAALRELKIEVEITDRVDVTQARAVD